VRSSAPRSDGAAAQDASSSAASAMAATRGFVALAMGRIIGSCSRLSHRAEASPSSSGLSRHQRPFLRRAGARGCKGNRCRPPAIAPTRDATLARDASELLGSAANPISAAAARQQGTSA
jgi:hypothetical protein